MGFELIMSLFALLLVVFQFIIAIFFTETYIKRVSKYLKLSEEYQSFLLNKSKCPFCNKLVLKLILISRKGDGLVECPRCHKQWKIYVKSKVEGDPFVDYPQIREIKDEYLRENLCRALNNITIENVDLGLFQLGKIFEGEIKSYLITAKEKGVIAVTEKDLYSLANMIDCLEKNGIITRKALLSLLREERNERAHGKMPNLSERENLLKDAPFLVDKYIEYILFFYNEREKLI